MTYHMNVTLQQSFPSITEAMSVLDRVMGHMPLANVYLTRDPTPGEPFEPSAAVDVSSSSPQPEAAPSSPPPAPPESPVSSATTATAAPDVSTPGGNEDELRELSNRYAAARSKAQLRDLIKAHGGVSLSTIPPSNHAAYIAAMKKELANG